MTRTYLDASVVLRIVLAQDRALPVHEFRQPVSSRLLRVECRRTLDRLATLGRITREEQVTTFRAAEALLTGVELADVDRAVLDRAGDPLPVPLRTLDAVHLSTALYWRGQGTEPVRVATHDAALAKAARLHGFEVIGA